MASVAAGRYLVRQPRDVRAETGLAGLWNDYALCAVVPGLRGRSQRASTSRPNCGDAARQLRAHSYRKYFERLQPQLTAEPYGQIAGNPGRAHSNRQNPEGHEDSKEKIHGPPGFAGCCERKGILWGASLRPEKDQVC